MLRVPRPNGVAGVVIQVGESPETQVMADELVEGFSVAIRFRFSWLGMARLLWRRGWVTIAVSAVELPRSDLDAEMENHADHTVRAGLVWSDDYGWQEPIEDERTPEVTPEDRVFGGAAGGGKTILTSGLGKYIVDDETDGT